MNGVFITGTDTNIGKTVVSAIIMHAFRAGRRNICYWKPIQTGIETDDDTQTVRGLANCGDGEVFDRGFRLERPLSPHLSARLAGASITVKKTLSFIEIERNDKFWVVEGAGGALVPLNESEMMIDLMKALCLPIIVVARSSLGTINHTLLTLEALRSRNLEILGVVINGEPNGENRRAIEYFGRVAVLAEVPTFEKLSGENLKVWAESNLNDVAFANK